MLGLPTAQGRHTHGARPRAPLHGPAKNVPDRSWPLLIGPSSPGAVQAPCVINKKTANCQRSGGSPGAEPRPAPRFADSYSSFLDTPPRRRKSQGTKVSSWCHQKAFSLALNKEQSLPGMFRELPRENKHSTLAPRPLLRPLFIKRSSTRRCEIAKGEGLCLLCKSLVLEERREKSPRFRDIPGGACASVKQRCLREGAASAVLFCMGLTSCSRE